MYCILAINKHLFFRNWLGQLCLSEEWEFVVKDEENKLISFYYWERIIPSCSGVLNTKIVEHSHTPAKVQIFEELGLFLPKNLTFIESIDNTKMTISNNYGESISVGCIIKPQDSSRTSDVFYLNHKLEVDDDLLSTHFDKMDSAFQGLRLGVGINHYIDPYNILSTDPDILLKKDLKGKSLTKNLFDYQSILINKNQVSELIDLKVELEEQFGTEITFVSSDEFY